MSDIDNKGRWHSNGCLCYFRGGHHGNLHLKTTIGDGQPPTPPQQIPPCGGTPHCLQAELGDLNDHELQQLIEDLTQEIVQHELTVPQATPSK